MVVVLKEEKDIEKQLILLHVNKHVIEDKKEEEKGKCAIHKFLWGKRTNITKTLGNLREASAKPLGANPFTRTKQV